MSQFGISIFETWSAFAIGDKTVKQPWYSPRLPPSSPQWLPIAAGAQAQEILKYRRAGRPGGPRGELGRRPFNVEGYQLLSYKNGTPWGHHVFSFLFQENSEILAFWKCGIVKYWVLCRWSNLLQILTLSSYWASCGGGFASMATLGMLRSVKCQ